MLDCQLFSFVFVSASSVFALLYASDPKLATDPDIEAEKAVSKASSTAEVYGITVSRPVVVSLIERDVTDWPKLFDVLLAGKGPAARVREYMSERVQKLRAADEVIDKLARATPPFEAGLWKGDFAFGFGKILDDPDFYNEAAFKGLRLSKEVQGLLSLRDKRTAWQTAWMNWRLMEAVFPGSIPEVPPRFRTIRVQVREGKDVILVLSSSLACHWEVDVKPGGRVTGVVLCGGEPQEIELIENPLEAPVVYWAAYAKDGKRRLKPNKYYDGYETSSRPEKKFEVREQFEAAMKGLMQKEFTSMQREHSPKSEPYVIRPAAK